MEIFILFGSYGDFEEEYSYPVKAYKKRYKAKAKCEELNEQLDEWKEKVQDFIDTHPDRNPAELNKEVNRITGGKYDYYYLREQNPYFIRECELDEIED